MIIFTNETENKTMALPINIEDLLYKQKIESKWHYII